MVISIHVHKFFGATPFKRCNWNAFQLGVNQIQQLTSNEQSKVNMHGTILDSGTDDYQVCVVQQSEAWGLLLAFLLSVRSLAHWKPAVMLWEHSNQDEKLRPPADNHVSEPTWL